MQSSGQDFRLSSSLTLRLGGSLTIHLQHGVWGPQSAHERPWWRVPGQRPQAQLGSEARPHPATRFLTTGRRQEPQSATSATLGLLRSTMPLFSPTHLAAVFWFLNLNADINFILDSTSACVCRRQIGVKVRPWEGRVGARQEQVRDPHAPGCPFPSLNPSAWV